MSRAIMVAAVLAAAVSAQTGAIAKPPAVSCGNHYLASTDLESVTAAIEVADDRACHAYGNIRVECENCLDECDKCDLALKTMTEQRAYTTGGIKQREAKERYRWGL